MLLVTFIGLSEMQLIHFAELRKSLRRGIDTVAREKHVKIDQQRIKFCALQSSVPPSPDGEKVFAFVSGHYSGDWVGARLARAKLKRALILKSLEASAEACLTSFSDGIVEVQVE